MLLTADSNSLGLKQLGVIKASQVTAPWDKLLQMITMEGSTNWFAIQLL